MKIVCVDITLFNDEKLKDIAKMFNFDYEVLLKDKKEGFKKLFIDSETTNVIAFNTKENQDLVMTDSFLDNLKSIEPITLPKKQKGPLTVDSILDKISKWGVESLNESEKKFLDDNSKI